MATILYANGIPYAIFKEPDEQSLTRTNCKNCGAPAGYGRINCEYCGSNLVLETKNKMNHIPKETITWTQLNSCSSTLVPDYLKKIYSEDSLLEMAIKNIGV